HVAGLAPAPPEATRALVAYPDGPPLGGAPHRGAPAEVEGLAGALEHVAHDPAVTGDAPEGLDAEGRAVDELGPAAAPPRQGLQVGDHVQRVAVDMTGRVELGPPGAHQVEEIGRASCRERVEVVGV